MNPHTSPSLSPQLLAQRIAALDWSGVSLQHLCAVTCAVETLLKVGETKMDNDLVIFAPEPTSSNVLPFPVQPRTMRHLTLLTLDGRQWCTVGFLPGDPGAAWAWVVEVVAHELSCSEDDVGCVEDPEGGGDLVTVEGLPVYRVAYGAPVAPV